jgi:K+-sensing histidine kinase KdpD
MTERKGESTTRGMGVVFRESSLVAAAHELKAPLALIRQLALMIERDGYNLEGQSRRLEQIILTSEKALRLTSDLTRSVRLEDALFPVEPINPQQLCEDIVKEMTPLFRAHNKSLVAVPHRRAPLLIGNRDLLRRVIANFVDNALYYASSEHTVHIMTKLNTKMDTVRVMVRDYGPALPINTVRTTADKLKMSESVHARPQSSGLGLYLAQQFALHMNGDVGVIRHKDGATFYIDLQASRQLSLL